MKISVLSLALLLGVFQVIQVTFADKPCNLFVDQVLEQLKADKDFFKEPFEIPDEDKSFAIYQIENGHMYGLNSLHRDGDVIPFSKDKTLLKVDLGVGELSLKITGRRRMFFLGQYINIEATIPYVSMELAVESEKDGTSPVITDFNIKEVKGLNVQISGLGAVKKILYNAFMRFARRFVRKMVRRSVEDRLKNFLTDKVKDFQVLKECLDDAWE